MNIGTKVQILLTEQNISRREFAKRLHISYSTLCGYLHNRRQPDYETLLNMSEILNTSTDFLLGRTAVRYHRDLFYAENEGILINNFRSLSPDMQTLLIKISNCLHGPAPKDHHFWK